MATKARNYTFTCNQPDDPAWPLVAWEALEARDLLKELKAAQLVVAEEYGTKGDDKTPGRLHYQGGVRFTSPVTFQTALKRVNEVFYRAGATKAHVEVMVKPFKATDYYTDQEGGRKISLGSEISPGARSDLSRARAAILEIAKGGGDPYMSEDPDVMDACAKYGGWVDKMVDKHRPQHLSAISGMVDWEKEKGTWKGELLEAARGALREPKSRTIFVVSGGHNTQKTITANALTALLLGEGKKGLTLDSSMTLANVTWLWSQAERVDFVTLDLTKADTHTSYTSNKKRKLGKTEMVTDEEETISSVHVKRELLALIEWCSNWGMFQSGKYQGTSRPVAKTSAFLLITTNLTPQEWERLMPKRGTIIEAVNKNSPTPSPPPTPLVDGVWNAYSKRD